MLYDRQIRALQARKQAGRYSDHPTTRGLYVQITPHGTAIFEHRYKVDGKDRYFNLGEFPATKLEEARKASGDIRKLVKKGIEPKEAAKAELAAEVSRKAELLRTEAKRERQGTVKALFQFYCDFLESRGQPTHAQIRRIYKADIAGVIGDMKVKDVTPDDIRAVLRPIIKRKKFIMANRVRSYLVAAFNFGIEWKDATNYDHKVEFDIAMNPAQAVRKPLKEEKAGERTLREKEIRAHWSGWGSADDIAQPAGIVLRLILATGGQRVEEVLRAQWSEFNFRKGLWELPPGRRKNHQGHVVPLGNLALAELKALKAQELSKELLFPGKPKADEPEEASIVPMRTDSLGQAVKRFCIRSKCDAFSPRDLRRTVKTLMGYQGIAKETRDRLQGHAMTDVSSKHYDRYDYLAEKRAAVEQWNEYLKGIVEGGDRKVVRLGKSA